MTAAAMPRTSHSKTIDMADAAMKKIEEALEKGIPKCYHKGFAFSPVDDFLIEWFPDLPWDPAGGKVAAAHILTTKKHLDVVRKFDTKFAATMKQPAKTFEQILTDMSLGTGDFA